MKCKCKLRKLINKDQVQGPTVVSSVNAKRLQSLQLRKNGSAERKKRTNGREITFSLQFSLLASKSLRGWGWEEVNPISALTTFVSLLCGKLYQWNCQTIRILGWSDSVECNPRKWRSVLECGSLINNTGSWAPLKSTRVRPARAILPYFRNQRTILRRLPSVKYRYCREKGGRLWSWLCQNQQNQCSNTSLVHQWFSNFFAGSPMESIPAELLFQIFRLITLKNCQKLSEKNKTYITRLLPNQDLMVAVQVCKHWRSVSIR